MLKAFFPFWQGNILENHRKPSGLRRSWKNLKKAEAMFEEMGMDYWLGRTRKILGKL